MAFQDFDQIKERVNAERRRKFRKKLILCTISFFILIALIVGGAFAYLTMHKNNESKNSEKPPASTSATAQALKQKQSEKIIKTLCNSSRYAERCKDTLTKAMKSNPSLANPKDLLKSSISQVGDEIDKVIKKAAALKIEDPDDKHAIEHCKKLMSEAKEELQSSVSKVNGADAKSFAKISPDLNNWLSAVMSYQETCLDEFQDGKLKSEVKKTLNSSQILTSNSLAIIKSFQSALSSAAKGSGAATRHLLGYKNDFPEWMSHEDRRSLKALDIKALKPNATVAKDGSGNFSTINEALKAMPEKYQGRYVIYVKQGVYDETVVVDKKKENLTLVGDGSQKTVVTGTKSNATKYRTFDTATFVAQGEGFMAQSIGFRNTAGPEGHQAVAARIQSDRSVFMNCRFEGYQDTLYAYTHRQFYRSCVIIGTIDFIFGDAAALFQNCNIYIRKGLSGQKNTVTAQGRVDPLQTTGFVLQNCTITADEGLKPAKKEVKSYLGRPWKKYSRTVVMESNIDDTIDPAGWLRWQESDFATDTLFYGEFKNDGTSAKTESRVKWPGLKVLKKEEALKFTVGPFLQGEWIKSTGAAVKFGLYDS